MCQDRQTTVLILLDAPEYAVSALCLPPRLSHLQLVCTRCACLARSPAHRDAEKTVPLQNGADGESELYLTICESSPKLSGSPGDLHRHQARATTTLSLIRRPLTKTTSTTSTKASTPTPTPAFNKKGISYNSINNTVPFSNKVGWAYNWFSAPEGNLNKAVQFNPMLWGLKDPWLLQIWDANVQAAIKNGSTHIL